MNHHIKVLIQVRHIPTSAKEMHIAHFLLTVYYNLLLVFLGSYPRTTYEHEMYIGVLVLNHSHGIY